MGKMTFGEWLKTERLARGLPQSDVEKRAEIAHSHYSKLERGIIGMPEPETRERIHKVFGTSDDDLADLGILEKQTLRSVDGQTVRVVYVRPDPDGPLADVRRVITGTVEQNEATGTPPEIDGLPAHLRTSFLKLQGLDEERQRIVERLINDLDTAAEVERQRLRRDAES